MNTVTTRYESSMNNWLTQPFEIGVRHLKVAFCDGSQETLLHMARERMIYRSRESEDQFNPLTNRQRFFHAIVGFLETAGYITIIVPFVVSAADRALNRPLHPKGGYSDRAHMEEGGNYEAISQDKNHWRANPFDENGKTDPFYQNASWTKENHNFLSKESYEERCCKKRKIFV